MKYLKKIKNKRKLMNSFSKIHIIIKTCQKIFLKK